MKRCLVLFCVLVLSALAAGESGAQQAPLPLEPGAGAARGAIVVEMNVLESRQFLALDNVYYLPVVDVAKALGLMAGTKGKDFWVYVQGKWYPGKTYLCDGSIYAELTELSAFLQPFMKVYLFLDSSGGSPTIYALTEAGLVSYFKSRQPRTVPGPPPAPPSPVSAPSPAPERSKLTVERTTAESRGTDEGLYLLVDVRNVGKSVVSDVTVNAKVSVAYSDVGRADRREYPASIDKIYPGQRIQVKIPLNVSTTSSISTTSRTIELKSEFIPAGPAYYPYYYPYAYPYPNQSQYQYNRYPAYPYYGPTASGSYPVQQKVVVSYTVALEYPEDGGR